MRRYDLKKQLGRFLRERRDTLTLKQFARKLGISDSSLQRLEIGEQNVTLDTLERILERLNCEVSDIFGVRAESHLRHGKERTGEGSV